MAFSNNSIRFNGTNGLIDVEYSTLLNFERTDAFSISCWAKTKSTLPINPIVSKMDSSSGTGYILFLNDSGQLVAILRNTPVTNSLEVRTVLGNFNEGGWHHFVMTYNGSGSVVLYVDGLPKNTTIVHNTLSASIKNSAPFQLGAYDGTNLFDGNIDEFALYTAVLSANNVLELFGSAKPKDVSSIGNLKCWWRMGDGDTYPILIDQTSDQYAFPTVPDLSGNGLDGIATNMEEADIVRDVPRSSYCKYSTHFDGTSDYYVMGNILPFERDESFSISCWAKTTAGGYLITKQDGSSPLGYCLQIGASSGSPSLGVIRFELANTWITNCIVAETTTTWADGEWHHICVSYDGSSSVSGITIYVDGENQAPLTTIYNNLSSSTANNADFYVGDRELDTGDKPFGGNITEVSLYYGGLSQGSVDWIYNSGLPRALDGYDAPANLIAWWRFGTTERVDEQVRDLVWGESVDDTQTLDMSRFANHAAPINIDGYDYTTDTPGGDSKFSVQLNTSVQPSYSDESISFDGINEYITMGDVTAFDRTTPFSVSLWVKSTTGGCLIGKSDVGSRGWFVESDATHVYLMLNYTYPTNTLYVGALHNLSDGGWHHIVVSYTGSSLASGVSFYVDGILKTNEVAYDSLISSILTSSPLQLGYRNSGFPNWFTGSLDEVALYNRAITETQAQWIYNSGAPRDLSLTAAPPGLVAWWRMGEWDSTSPLLILDSGPSAVPNTVRDLSGNNYNGTMTSMEATDVVYNAPGRGLCVYGDTASSHSIAINYGVPNGVVAYDRTNKFSVSWWAKYTTFGAVCSKVSAGYQGWWIINGYTGCQLILNVSYGTNTLLVTGNRTGAAFYSDQRWHHFVITYDGSSLASGVKVYIDGIEADSYTVTYDNLTSSIIYSPTDVFVIGTVNNTNYFNGRMRDLAIWGKTLSATEAAWLYNSGQPKDHYAAGYPGNLDGWWRLGDGDKFPEFYDSGPYAYHYYVVDQSFNNYLGATANMEVEDVVYDAPGHAGKSVMFGGTDEYATAGNVLGFERTTPFSVSCWFKTSYYTGAQHLLTKMDGSPGFRGRQLYLSTSGVIYASLISDWAASNRAQVHSAASKLNNGVWHHVVMTSDGSSTAAGIKLYIDGAADAVVTDYDTLTGTILSSAELRLGAYMTAGNTLVGNLTGVAVYDRALSLVEAQWIYNSGVPRDLTGVGAPLDLAAWWKCGDGDIHPTLADSIVTLNIPDMVGSYDGSAANMELADIVSDTPNTSLSTQFNGISDYITMGNVLSFLAISPFSISLWFKSTSTSGYMVSKMDGATLYRGYAVGCTTGGSLNFILRSDESTGNKIVVSTVNTFCDGDWHHVVWTYDGASLASGIYCIVDGVSQTLSVSFNALSGAINSTSAFVLAAREGSADFYAGHLDEVAVYNRDLSISEAQWIYNGGEPRDLSLTAAPSSLVAWWKMGEWTSLSPLKILDSGPSAIPNAVQDLSGNNHTGTMTSMESSDVISNAPGRRQCAYFSGTDYMSFDNVIGPIAYDRTDRFSVSWWSWCDDDTFFGTICSKIDVSWKGWWIEANSAGGPVLKLNASTYGSNTIAVSGVPTSAGWHHFVITYDGSSSASGVNIYVDGYEVSTTIIVDNLTSSIIGSTNDPFYVGTAASSNYFTGKIRDLALWGTDLSSSDAAWLYNSGQPRNLYDQGGPQVLENWWRLGDGDKYPEFYDSGPASYIYTQVDQSHGNHTGTAVNMEHADVVYDAPGHGKSVMFDGVNEYATAGNVLAFERTDSFSLSVWIKSSTGSAAIMGKWNNTTGQGYGIWLSHTSLSFGLINTYPTNQCSVWAPPCDDGKWHHAVFCYDGYSSAANIRCYIDGAPVSLTIDVDTLTGSILTSSNFQLAGRDTGANFNGRLNNAAVYSKFLSQTEAEWLYNDGDPPDLHDLGSPNNLAAWWKTGNGDVYPTLLDMGDSAAPNAVEDLSGNDYVGTMTNMESSDIVSDVPGAPLSTYFDGVDGYVTMGDVLDFDYNQAFSVSGWFKTSSGGGYVVSKKGNATDGYIGWGITVRANNSVGWSLTNTEGTYEIDVETTETTFSDNQWHHVLVSYNGNGLASGCIIYVDGTARTKSTLYDNLGSNTTVSANSLNIGARTDGEVLFTGNISNVSIHDRALSSVEASWIYNSGTPRSLTGAGSPSDLLAWWKCGDGDIYPTLLDSCPSATWPIIPDEMGSYSGTTTNMELGDIIYSTPGGISVKALSFGGVDEYVTMGNVLDFGDRADPRSFSFWIRTTATGGTIIAKWDGTKGYRIGIRPDGTIWCYANSGSLNFVISSIAINDGNWHHVVFVRFASCFIDGVTRIGSTSGLSEDTTNSAALQFGNHAGGGSGTAFVGDLDEVAFYWGTNLTLTDAQWIYNSGVPRSLTDAGAPSGLTAWWKMGDGPSYPGTMANMLVTDFVGDSPGYHLLATKSLLFDGADEYVTMGDVLGFERTDSFSICFWIRTTVTGYVVTKREGATAYRGYGVYQNPATTEFFLTNNTGTNDLDVSAPLVSDGLWHHVVWTYGGGSNAASCKCYIDGVSQSITTNVSTLNATIITTAPFNLASRTNGVGCLTGNLDEVAVYNRALTATEATWIYNTGVPRDLSLTAAPSGLVGWWRMGEGAYPAAMTNMESYDIVADAPGDPSMFAKKSLLFDGADEYITAGNTLGFEYNSRFSISAWFKSTNTANANFLVAKMEGSTLYRGYGLDVTTSGMPRLTIRSTTINAIEVYDATKNLLDGQWHHILGTYDGSSLASGCHIWVDGVDLPLTAGSNNLTTTIVTTSPLLLGAFNNGAEGRLAGNLDEVAIYSRDLSASEVASIYNSGVPRDLKNTPGLPRELLAWWRMGEIGCRSNSVTGTWQTRLLGDSPGLTSNFATRSFAFDGSLEYVDMGNIFAYERNQPFSISCWARWVSTATGAIIAKCNGSNVGYCIYKTGGGGTGLGNVVFEFRDAGAATFSQSTTKWGLGDGNWHHIVATYDGSSSQAGALVYIDGELLGYGGTGTLASSIVTSSSLRIGYRYSDLVLTGGVDEVSIYDKELSANEVSWIYNSGLPRNLRTIDAPPGLQAWWRLGEGAYPGTMTNMSALEIVGDSPGSSAFDTKSMVFDGINEHIAMGNVLGFERTDAFSISLWAKWISSASSMWIAGKGDGATTYRGYFIYANAATGSVRFELHSDAASSNFAKKGTTAGYNDGKWHHIVCTSDGSSSAAGMNIYVDGYFVDVTTIADSLTGTIVNSAEFTIGNRVSNPIPFDGLIDEVAAYDRELTIDDVIWIYNGSIPRDLSGVGAPSDLVAWWQMGEGASETSYDATMTNMESYDIVADYPADTYHFAQKSHLFDGVNEYVSMGDVLDFDRTNAFSVSCWVKSTNTSTTSFIIAKGAGSVPEGWWVLMRTDGLIVFALTNTPTTNDLRVRGSVAVNDGQWHHVLCVHTGTGTAAGVKIYVDGVENTYTIESNNLTGTTVNAASLRIGTRENGFPNECFKGNLSEVAVYNRELSAAEVSWIYNSGKPRDLKNAPGAPLSLVGWWRLGAGGYRSSSATGTWQTRILGDRPGLVSDFATKSLAFDGFTEYVDFGNVLAFERTQAFSISCWARWISTDYGALVAKEDGSYVGYALYKYSDGVVFELRGVGGSTFGQYAIRNLGNGAWHHIVATYDGSSTKEGSKIYIDGIDTTYGGTGTISASIVTTAPLRIGMRQSDLALTGEVDEVSIYGKELTPAEVTWIFDSGAPRDLRDSAAPSNLAGWWRLGEGAYPGTMTNMSASNIVNGVQTGIQYFVTAAGTNQIDFGAEYGHKWTVGAWIKTTESSGVIINKNYSADLSGWGMRLVNGYHSLWWANNPATLITEQRSDVAVNDGYWHHVLALREKQPGGTPICKFYVDGVLTGTVTVTDTNANNTIDNYGMVSIGVAKGSGGGTEFFSGNIAEVSVWRGHLSTTQISEVYNGGSPPNLINLDSEPNLAGWWKCGDDGGYPGVPVSILTSARVGDAPGEESFGNTSFEMDGSNEYIDMGNVLNYERTDAFSISCWFKSRTRSELPVSKIATDGWYFDGFDGLPIWMMEGATGSIQVEFGHENIIQPSEWYHIVVTYNGSSTAAGTKVYINGISIPVANVVLDTLTGSILGGGLLYIGRRATTYHDGNTNEVSAWGKELNQSEVTELYNDGAPANLTQHSAVDSLDGWWRLTYSGATGGNNARMVNMLSSDIVSNSPKEPGVTGERIYYYLMRGIDSACGTLTYHHWLVTEAPDFAGAQAGTLPCGGPLVDIVIASTWSVIN